MREIFIWSSSRAIFQSKVLLARLASDLNTVRSCASYRSCDLYVGFNSRKSVLGNIQHGIRSKYGRSEHYKKVEPYNQRSGVCNAVKEGEKKKKKTSDRFRITTVWSDSNNSLKNDGLLRNQVPGFGIRWFDGNHKGNRLDAHWNISLAWSEYIKYWLNSASELFLNSNRLKIKVIIGV